jgi:hemoglobin/transferrin/lactoferrin receptor protein
MPTIRTRINGGLSTGFRAPNIDDLARIFESSTATRQLIIPNPDIKPEYTFNFDLGISQIIVEKIKLELTAFYTLFKNAIAIAPFKLNGQDSVNYNGTMSKVFANQNVNEAFIYGFNAGASIDLTTALNLYSSINYTYGRLKPNKGSKVPLDHIPPVYGKTALSYFQKIVSAEIYALYNGWKKLKDYNTGGEDNLQYATPDGMPSWFTLNFKTTIRLHEKLSLQAGVENILDRNYRQFASGFSAPGRNFIFALRSNF